MADLYAIYLAERVHGRAVAQKVATAVLNLRMVMAADDKSSDTTTAIRLAINTLSAADHDQAVKPSFENLQRAVDTTAAQALRGVSVAVGLASIHPAGRSPEDRAAIIAFVHAARNEYKSIATSLIEGNQWGQPRIQAMAEPDKIQVDPDSSSSELSLNN